MDKTKCLQEQFDIGTLLKLSSELFKKSSNFHNFVNNNEPNELTFSQLKLAEIYTDFNCLKAVILAQRNDRLELMDLLESWLNFYDQLVSVVEDNDANTSWEYSEFSAYEKAHNEATEILSNHFKHLKTQL